MTREEAAKLLLEMQKNCEQGTAYDDPLRAEKHEALRMAVDALAAMDLLHVCQAYLMN